MRTQPDLIAAFAVIEEAVDRHEGRARDRISRLVTAAALGSGLMAATSWQTAAIPWSRSGPAWLVPGFVAYYGGLAALTVAWLLMGRIVLDADTAAPVRAVRQFILAGAGPFVVAAPLGRDLWAYAAQGHLLSTGRSPYDYGPGAAPGAFARQVSTHWLFSPAPYGPLWLRLSQAAAWVAHGNPVVAALILRIPALFGLALCAWAVPVLAERIGVARSPVALWLGVASPLVLVLGIGGGHNDLLMLGLALAGIAVATRCGLMRLALGAGIATLGVLVKSPAAIAVAFTVPASLVAGPRPTAHRFVTSCLAMLAGCGATLFGVTAATGLGFGWTHRVSSYAGWVNWLSLPSGLTMLVKALTGDRSPCALDDTLRTARTVGEIVAVVLIIALWVLAAKRPATTVRCLAIAFGASAVLAPAVQPWYFTWGLVLAGLVVPHRAGALVLPVVGLVFPIMVLPSGTDLDNHWTAIPVLVAAVALVRLFLRREWVPRSGTQATLRNRRFGSGASVEAWPSHRTDVRPLQGRR